MLGPLHNNIAYWLPINYIPLSSRCKLEDTNRLRRIAETILNRLQEVRRMKQPQQISKAIYCNMYLLQATGSQHIPPHARQARFHADYFGNEATVERCFLLVSRWHQTQQYRTLQHYMRSLLGKRVFDISIIQ